MIGKGLCKQQKAYKKYDKEKKLSLEILYLISFYDLAEYKINSKKSCSPGKKRESVETIETYHFLIISILPVCKEHPAKRYHRGDIKVIEQSFILIDDQRAIQEKIT